MDKEQLRKEFNDFLDSASDATVKDFLKFLKDRKAQKSGDRDTLKNGLSEDDLSFKNRSNQVDIILVSLAAILMVIGILGSLLPVLPGVPISWTGLLVFYLAPSVPVNYWFLGSTLFIAILIYALNLIIPAMGTKRYGGSKSGMIGATLGLVVGLISPIPFGVIIGPFVGAFIGEIINNSNRKSALKAAFGSFIGFLASSFMELVVALSFLILFLFKVWQFKAVIF